MRTLDRIDNTVCPPPARCRPGLVKQEWDGDMHSYEAEHIRMLSNGVIQLFNAKSLVIGSETDMLILHPDMGDIHINWRY